MKFNWGSGIVIAIIVMVAAMSFLVSIAVRQKFDLVENDYYQKSIAYQQHISKVENTAALAKKITFKLTTDTLKLIFPNLTSYPDYSGEIHFYSPVDSNRDYIIPIKLDTSYMQPIVMKNLKKGRYQVKIEWIANQISYYQEEDIVVEK